MNFDRSTHAKSSKHHASQIATEITEKSGTELAGMSQDFKEVRKQIDGRIKRLEAKKAAQGPKQMAEDQKLMSYTIQQKYGETEQDVYEAMMEFENKHAYE